MPAPPDEPRGIELTPDGGTSRGQGRSANAAMTMSLSVVIPVYNSSEILTALHARLTKVLRESGAEYEVVLVDDDSPDASWATLRRLAAQDDRVVAVHLRRNAGYDNALLAGMGRARHAVVVVMDDDLQHAPEDIPTL